MPPQRILIYGLNYAPELVGVGKYTSELAEWFVEQGHQVRVICAPPYYPDWRVREGYSAARYRREWVNGVDVWRSPIWVPKRPHGASRIVHLLSFAFASAWPLFRSVGWKPDCLVLVLPSLVCAPAAILFSRISGSASWVHVQDFELAAATALGMTRHRRLFKVLGWLEGILYRGFDRVTTISNRMLSRLVDEGVPAARAGYFPNWVNCAVLQESNAAQARARFGLPENEIVALYAGTLGYKQGIEVILEAARILRGESALRFVICGSGPEADCLKALAGDLQNVTWLEPQSSARLTDLLRIADIHLLPQRVGAADLVLPSKLGGMLASGRPIIATVDAGTEIADIVQGRGIVVPPADPRAMASAIETLMGDPAARERYGTEARRYAECSLDKSVVLSRFQEELLQLTQCESG